MGTGTLTRYSASAGSGKTFRLASIYLSHLFRDPESYRRILAVTFTNKATAEMKNRILEQLHVLAKGGESKYLEEILRETGKDELTVRKMAGNLLSSILHDFSRFSVSTIDAFFQKVIRAFARESGLHSGFNIELDYSLILSEGVDWMIASSADDNELRNWLNEYISSKLTDEKSWNPRDEILKLAEEIFREKFKILSESEQERLSDKKYLLGFIAKLKDVKQRFEETLLNAGRECEKFFIGFHLTDDMFYYRGKGVPGFVHSIAGGRIMEPNTYVKAAISDPPRWTTGQISTGLRNAVEGGFGDAVRKAVSYYESNIVHYNSVKEILSSVYALGILSDILKNVREIASSENSFLIADSGELLRALISDDQAPFIYEKIGNRYDIYMIDEFQDTSRMQWGNFFPLIEESMGNGNDNLVVGDVKQSIYRFRNSEWQILGRELDKQIPDGRLRSVPLDSNWRSRTNIIRFNNTLFTVIPGIIDSKLSRDPSRFNFRDIYSEAIQEDAGKKSGGFVRIEFIDNDYETKISDSGRESKRISKSWEDKVLEKLPAMVEFFQDKGFSASDIGIIVRTSHQGTNVLNTMISYSNNAPVDKKEKYNYNVVSDYSLTLSNSHAITFIVSVLKVIINPGDEVSLAAMLRFWLLATGSPEAERASLAADSLRGGTFSLFPDGYRDFMDRVGRLPLFEVVENIIAFFRLGNFTWNVVYLNAFQDLVIGFSAKKNNDLHSFIEWWERTGKDTSVVLPENQDAARIFTIHKSKGLEFKVVLLPFLSWNDDHNTRFREIIWIKPPEVEPFCDLGILPVTYRRDPPGTVFDDFIMEEKYSAYLDNLNLLYVAMTRARDAIWGCAAAIPGNNEGISNLLIESFRSDIISSGGDGIRLSDYYDSETGIFEFGEVQGEPWIHRRESDLPTSAYNICRNPGSLKLRLHGENYILPGMDDIAGRINYGKLMHRAFEYIGTPDDIPGSVNRLVVEGEIPPDEADYLINRLNQLVSEPEVSDWFNPSSEVMREADILLPSGNIRRPDRIVIDDGRVKVIDFKFGDENQHYQSQVRRYCRLLNEMGYSYTEGFIWYVDCNKVIKV